MIEWLTTTDHKKIGIMYMVATGAFFVAAGVLAMLIRTQLAVPDNTFLGAHAYNQVFTLHGTLDDLFRHRAVRHRLGELSGAVADRRARRRISASQCDWAVAFRHWGHHGVRRFLHVRRRRGNRLDGLRSPQRDLRRDGWWSGFVVHRLAHGEHFDDSHGDQSHGDHLLAARSGNDDVAHSHLLWEIVATALLILMSFPSLACVFAMALLDRHMGARFFDPAFGGNPILYQHLFWFFGHPEVYVMILPYFGIVTEIVATFSRKPVFGYVGLVISAFAIAGLSLGVWAHHMFTTGAVSNPFFSAVSFLIAVPTGVKFVNWIGTMWKGSIEFSTPMLFAIGFMLNFLVGGITGVMVASPPLDYQAHDSYFVVQHFHYTIGGGSMFALFGAVYFWFPKMFGVKLDERLGRWFFALMFVGFNLTFIPMGFMGVEGMARRVFTYPAIGHLALLNALATAGAVLMTIGVVVFAIDVIVSVRRRVPVGDNPWGAYTLEWLTSSPPPEFNFEKLPPIRSRRPALDDAVA